MQLEGQQCQLCMCELRWGWGWGQDRMGGCEGAGSENVPQSPQNIYRPSIQIQLSRCWCFVLSEFEIVYAIIKKYNKYSHLLFNDRNIF